MNDKFNLEAFTQDTLEPASLIRSVEYLCWITLYMLKS